MIKKSTLVEDLIGKSHGYNRTKLQQMPKKKLQDLYNEYELGNIDVGKIEIKETVEPKTKENTIHIKGKEENKSKNKPKIDDPEWTDYVISLLVDKKEKYDGIPSCDGLRRVFGLLIGDIHSSEIEVVSAPSAGEMINCATVISRIYYKEHSSGNMKLIADVFNVNPTNTKWPWFLPATATAATKAEARALRKGLRLVKILSQEEVDQGFENDKGTISTEGNSENPLAPETAKITIRNLCNKFNIDINKLIKYMGIKEENLDSLRKTSAQNVIRQINEYSVSSDIPEEISNSLDSL